MVADHAIARAVITRPKLLLADEPTGNVDDKMGLRLMHLFEELNKLGTTVIVATHNLGIVRQLAHPVMRLENGRLNTDEAEIISDLGLDEPGVGAGGRTGGPNFTRIH